MKIFRFMILATLLSFAACQNDEALLAVEDVVEGNPVENIISAMIEQCDATKTIKDENNRILWSENDEIIAFMKSSHGHKYQVQPSFVGQDYADFSLVLPEGDDLFAGVEWEHNVAYYPYSDAIECDKSGDHYELDIEIPSVQIYVPNGFGPMPMVAVSENNEMVFKNLLGAIKLSIKGSQVVKSIKIEGNGGEHLCGAATVTAYSVKLPPVIRMSDDASAEVTLDCGDGVQLSESEATDFYFMLPQQTFSNGFIVTVIDLNEQCYVVEAKYAVLFRSSILAMPIITLDSVEGGILIENEKEDVISDVTLSDHDHTLYVGDLYQLTATVSSKDSANANILWRSLDADVALVDQNGFVKPVAEGKTTIYAVVGNKKDSCEVEVYEQPVPAFDYIDEYGINHGKGISLCGAVWAPVNCGYHATDYQWGKLYQWGRKYGQGYYGWLYDVDGKNCGTTTDATTPITVRESVSGEVGNSESNANNFYLGGKDEDYDWKSSGGGLWVSGTEDAPVKTKYDPCPEGWRVPTRKELEALSCNYSSWTTNELNQPGRRFFGSSLYSKEVHQVFFPAAGYRNGRFSDAQYRGKYGYYWSSDPYYSNRLAYHLYFSDENANRTEGYRAGGLSVRCVQE